MKVIINGTEVEGTASEIAALIIQLNEQEDKSKKKKAESVKKKAEANPSKPEWVQMDLISNNRRAAKKIKKPKMSRKGWTKSQDDTIKTLVGLKTPTKIIAESLGRTSMAIQKRARKLDVQLTGKRS